jgi:hypothetical protein
MTLRDMTISTMASLGLDYKDPKRVSKKNEQSPYDPAEKERNRGFE